MDGTSALISGALVLLAVAHSVLGEREILQPLFRAKWAQPAPRWAMERILRFAWHLTSITWLGLAAAALGVSLPHVFAAFGLVSAAMIFVMLRGHLAWPLFALIGFAGLEQAGLLTRPILGVLALAAAAVAAGAAGFHFYWAGGGKRGAAVVIPERNGAPAFKPPAWLTAGVGIALLTFTGLLGWVWTGAAPEWARWMLVAALVAFVVRAIGDGRTAGFTKQDRSTAFARWDDRLFTPIVVLLAFGTSAVLLG